MLPFTRAQFLDVFATYNSAVWPAQIIAYVLGGCIIALLPWRSALVGRYVAAGLAAMWLWTGVAYHGVFFSAINVAAPAFAALFVLEAVLLVYFGVAHSGLRFAPPSDWLGWLGAALIAYSAILYPLIGISFGHRYPEIPMFGITPCPVTLFTFGLLSLTTAAPRNCLLIVPLAWSLIGGTAAFMLSVQQDWVLLLSGVLVPLIVFRNRQRG